MIFIFPVGHQKLVERFPFATLTLIALNFLIFIFTDPIADSQRERYLDAKWALKSERDRIYRKYGDDYLKWQETTDAPGTTTGQGQSTAPPTQQASPQKPLGFMQKYLEEQKELRRKKDKFFRDFDLGIVPGVDQRDQKAYEDTVNKFEDLERKFLYTRFGFIPTRFYRLHTWFTSLFLHGGWLHLLGNMFFLWLTGCNIEDKWGKFLFVSFYLFSGAASNLMHALHNFDSAQPVIGASGAVAGLMGAFTVRFYDTKIKFIWFYLLIYIPRWGSFWAPAWLMGGLWFLLELGKGILYSSISHLIPIAFWSHVGGFIFGAAVVWLFMKYNIEQKYIEPRIKEDIVDFHEEMSKIGMRNRTISPQSKPVKLMPEPVLDIEDNDSADDIQKAEGIEAPDYMSIIEPVKLTPDYGESEDISQATPKRLVPKQESESPDISQMTPKKLVPKLEPKSRTSTEKIQTGAEKPLTWEDLYDDFLNKLQIDDPMEAIPALDRLILFYRNNNKGHKARQAIDRFLERHPHQPIPTKILFYAAQACEKREAYQDALDMYQMILQWEMKEENVFKAKLHKADILLKHFSKSVEAFEIYIELKRDFPNSKWDRLLREKIIQAKKQIQE